MDPHLQTGLGERIFGRHTRLLRHPLLGRVALRRLPLL
jgi:hypothetical protein